MNLHVVNAIFRRNFLAYFSNPTGYVFICLFVLLSGIAAFWPNEFFNANLANLDQLNRFFPLIMLIFVPAITMSIWAEERRQGTDELLLTIPASDFDVVVGKYLAAVAIYSAALFFSLFNVLALRLLGQPDWGLLVGTYAGYWCLGLAMLGLGMIASFFTSNLTVGFILGVLFNAPLVFASSAEAISGLVGATGASAIRHWSFAEQFRDFGRGVISLSGIAYFLLLVVLAIYVSMVLIGRRHWLGGRDGQSLVGHYFVRIVAVVAVILSAITLLARHDRRLDVTSAKLSSLSPQSIELIDKLDAKRPVRIEAFVSPRVPESYVPTRLNLLSMLRELAARAPNKVLLNIHDTEQLSEEAQRAETQFGIKGQQVASRTRGAMNIEEIYLGMAFSAGLEKVVVPFVDRGTPVEYELVRSLATLSQAARKKVGVLTTDAKLYGGFDMQTMSSSPNEQIIDELQKQFEVVQVNPDSPITERYDVLLAVQPSSLTQPQMDNFMAAVRSGQPTAVFEDPFPYLDSRVPGTSAPKQPPGGNMFMMNQQPPQPKGNILPLWNLLGVSFSDRQVVWQDYNPYPKIGQFPKEFVFVDKGANPKDPFSESEEISSKLQQMLFLFPGFVTRSNASGLEFRALVRTGVESGVVAFDEILDQGFFGRSSGLNPARFQRPTREAYVLAAHVRGKLNETIFEMSDSGYEVAQADAAAEAPATPTPDSPSEAPAENAPVSASEEAPQAEGAGATEAADVLSAPAEAAAEAGAAGTGESAAPAGGGEAAATPAAPGASGPKEKPEINVVLVADIDCLYSAFFSLRSRGDDPEAEVNLAVDNVTFVLNTLDVLANDERFIEIRKRRPLHRTLTTVEEWTEDAKGEANKLRDDFFRQFNEGRDKEQAQLDAEVSKLRDDQTMDPQEKLIKLQTLQEVGQRRLDARIDQLKKTRDREIQRIERELAVKVGRVQDRFKFVAVAVPPIFPFLLGAFVFVTRRAREKEGVSRARLR